MKVNNRKIKLPVLALAMVLTFAGCNEEKEPVKPVDPGNSPTYNTLAEFYKANEVMTEKFTVDATAGGSFVTTKGTKVTIRPNALTDEAGNPVTGPVIVELRDIYEKSDMMLSGMPTMMVDGRPLKSGGEFFIRIMQEEKGLIPGNGKAIEVELPLNGEKLDDGMGVFKFEEGNDSTTKGTGWWPSPADSMRWSASSYILSLYEFSTPATKGTWCNSDNNAYFASYPQTKFTIKADAAFNPDIYLSFKNINSMVHVYQEQAGSFPYYYAPMGLPCTVVVLGVKDGKLYSSFTDITISANQTVNVSLQETTESAFKSKLQSLNN